MTRTAATILSTLLVLLVLLAILCRHTLVGLVERGVRRYTQGSALNQQKLVLAQDTGGAIIGAVRADLFTGWGGWTDPAYQLAGKLKQPLQLWALWPR